LCGKSGREIRGCRIRHHHALGRDTEAPRSGLVTPDVVVGLAEKKKMSPPMWL